MRKLLIRVLCYPIRIYQVCISPLFPPCCRYYPSCSNYALGSIKKHGPLKGSYLSMRRIVRCNSLFPGGYDPVP